jgi:sporulation protein YlmC with PRC-barrel domain
MIDRGATPVCALANAGGGSARTPALCALANRSREGRGLACIQGLFTATGIHRDHASLDAASGEEAPLPRHRHHRRIGMAHLQAFSSSPVKASSVIGTSVVNPKSESLGDIKEIVIDPHTGRVAYAVVSFGGFLGMGSKLFAVPFGSFEYNATKNHYVIDISKDRLTNAPGFDPDHWPAMADEKWNREVHKFYDRSPYWE